MCAEDYGVREVLRAADAVTCKCAEGGCVIQRVNVERLTEEQADPIPVRWTEPKEERSAS